MKVKHIILTVILVLVAIFLVHTIRNHIIVSNIQNKASKYFSSTNRYIKETLSNDTLGIHTTALYVKDDKRVKFVERAMQGSVSRKSYYKKGNQLHDYIESRTVKVASISSVNPEITSLAEQDIIPPFYYLPGKNIWDNILFDIQINIKTVEYDGKICYKIIRSIEPFEGEIYIEKETGLVLKTYNRGSQTLYEYGVNNVDDSIFIEPEISEYKIYENNPEPIKNTDNWSE